MHDAIEIILYSGKTRATGGRNGTARSSDPEGTAVDDEVDLGGGVDAYGRCANNGICHSGYRQCALQ
jgi:hypothetical protein